MNERDYLRLKRQFTEDFETKLKALELIWLESSGGKKPPKELAETNGAAVERGNSAASVEEFVRQWVGDPFTAKQVEAWITQVKGLSANRTTIIHKLRRMVNDGELNLVMKGSGKRASMYATPASLGMPPGVNLILPDDSVSEPTDEPEHEPAMATEQDIEQLREIIRSQEIVLSEFRANVLQGEYGVQKAGQLTREQIQELIFRYTPVPPSDEIPF